MDYKVEYKKTALGSYYRQSYTLIKTIGLFGWIQSAFKFIFDHFRYFFGLYKQTFFEFKGIKLPYFMHNYNMTWSNMRAVEIPIVRIYLNEFRNKRILEVGNVLSHYFDVQRLYSRDYIIVDKYEKSAAVTNCDLVDFRPKQKFDLIISISTLEHVGWDERKKDPHKLEAALSNLKNLLAPHGVMVVTAPLGYNPNFDKFLRLKNPFDKIWVMHRQPRSNIWKETAWHRSLNVPLTPASLDWMIVGIYSRKNA